MVSKRGDENPIPICHAQLSTAWDDIGAEYTFQGSYTDNRDAARAIKHGARLGVLSDWGRDDSITWIDIPVFEGSKALKGLSRWVDALVSRVANPSLSHWRAVAGDNEMILIWDDCTPL